VELKAGLDVGVTSISGNSLPRSVIEFRSPSSQSQLTEMSLVIIAMPSVNANFGAEIRSGKLPLLPLSVSVCVMVFQHETEKLM
jgi:hypothetical protein